MIKKRALSYILVLTTIIFFTSCSKPSNDKIDFVDTEPIVDSESIEKEYTVASKSNTNLEEDEITNEVKEKIYTTGNINFTYDEGLEIKDIDGLPYFYYSDTSFFYAESSNLDLMGEEFNEDFVDTFFASTEASFSQGSWTNGKIANGPSAGEFNDLTIWICEVDMEREGVPYVSSNALVYYDGILTNLTLISDLNAYEVVAYNFAETIKSMSPAE